MTALPHVILRVVPLSGEVPDAHDAEGNVVQFKQVLGAA